MENTTRVCLVVKSLSQAINLMEKTFVYGFYAIYTLIVGSSLSVLDSQG